MSGTFTQTRFKPELFAELLNGPSTYRLAYRRAHLCPNRGDRGGHVPDCPVCGGLGYYWQDPLGEVDAERELTRAGVYADSERLPSDPSRIISVTDEDGVTYDPATLTVQDGQVTWADGAPRPADYRLYTVRYAAPSTLRGLVQGVTTQREFATRGEYDVMDIQLTVDRAAPDGSPNPLWDAGEHDRVILLDTWRRHSQHLQRGVLDALVYRRVRDVRLTSVVSGALRVWEPGTDYVVEDGRVVWQAGRGPARQAHYAAEAQVSPEYYVFQVLPQTRHMDGQDMPRRFVLRGFEKHPSERPVR